MVHFCSYVHETIYFVMCTLFIRKSCLSTGNNCASSKYLVCLYLMNNTNFALIVQTFLTRPPGSSEPIQWNSSSLWIWSYSIHVVWSFYSSFILIFFHLYILFALISSLLFWFCFYFVLIFINCIYFSRQSSNHFRMSLI